MRIYLYETYQADFSLKQTADAREWFFGQLPVSSDDGYTANLRLASGFRWQTHKSDRYAP